MRRHSRAWIFVSHSTKDLEKVRRVRNAIEEAGGEPVLFFLKCLDDHDEIEDLVKKEIEARNFFLLCDSGNARDSDWVKSEIAHVESLDRPPMEVIDLDGDWEAQLARIRELILNASVFLAYSRREEGIVAPVREALQEADIAVWDDKELVSGESWSRAIDRVIEGTARFGYFLHFISAASLTSKFIEREVKHLRDTGYLGGYIPILLDQIPGHALNLPAFIRERQWLDFSDRNVDALVHDLLVLMGARKRR